MTNFSIVTAAAVPKIPALFEQLLSDAHELRKVSSDVEDCLDDVSSTWRRLEESYETGHTDLVLAQTEPLKSYALDLADAFSEAADTLIAFADTIADTDAIRTSLLTDIEQLYRGLNATPVPFSERLDLRARNVQLWQQANALQRKLDSAVETARERLAQIQDPPTLPHENSEQVRAPGNADWLESMRHVLLSYLSAPIFAMLQHLVGAPLSPDLEAALRRVAMNTGPVDADTQGLERAWLLWGIAHGGELYSDPEGPCGDRMVCVVGDLPTGKDGNAIALGRVVVFDRVQPNLPWQFHEYAHVVDQVDIGSRRFLEDYAHEAAFATVIGEDSHRGNIFEQSAELRANASVEARNHGQDPYQVFSVTHYDSGFQPTEGNVGQWLAWDAAARGNLTNTWRMQQIRRNMGIEGYVQWHR